MSDMTFHGEREELQRSFLALGHGRTRIGIEAYILGKCVATFNLEPEKAVEFARDIIRRAEEVMKTRHAEANRPV